MQAAQENLTPEQQLQLVRDHLVKDLVLKYKEFISEFLKLPLELHNFKRAFEHFDDGILWAKEVITFANIIPKKVSTDNVTSLPVVPAETKVEEGLTEKN